MNDLLTNSFGRSQQSPVGQVIYTSGVLQDIDVGLRCEWRWLAAALADLRRIAIGPAEPVEGPEVSFTVAWAGPLTKSRLPRAWATPALGTRRFGSRLSNNPDREAGDDGSR